MLKRREKNNVHYKSNTSTILCLSNTSHAICSTHLNLNFGFVLMYMPVNLELACMVGIYVRIMHVCMCSIIFQINQCVHDKHK